LCRLAFAQVDVERLDLEATESVGTFDDRDDLRFALDGGGGDLRAIGQGEVDALGGELTVEGGFDAGDATFDLGVGEDGFDARTQWFGAELGFDPEKGGSEDDGKDADAPEGKAENAGHRDGHVSCPAALTGQQKARWNCFHRAKSAVWTS